MKKTVIYVFGPRRLASIYYSNKPMNLGEGGWLKIGQTTNAGAGIDVKDSALNRIRQETHTGIPEICQIFDVFEYPKRAGKTDDIIRKILTDGVYDLENSKLHNAQVNIEKYEIKAGEEFVYGVSRKQVLNAIAKFEHSLILQNYGNDDFEDLMQCIKNNAQNAELEDTASEDYILDSTEGEKWTDNLWRAVQMRLSNDVKTTISIPKGRSYFFISSATFKDTLKYVISYSVRSGLASVGVETYKGEEGKTIIEDKMNTVPSENQIKTLEAKQGVKNKDKWAWSMSDTIEKSFEELVQWYVDTIRSFYQFFEK